LRGIVLLKGYLLAIQGEGQSKHGSPLKQEVRTHVPRSAPRCTEPLALSHGPNTWNGLKESFLQVLGQTTAARWLWHSFDAHIEILNRAVADSCNKH